MPGPEVDLTVELGRAILGEPVTTQQYLQTDGSGGLLSGDGSQNIPLLSWAVRLLAGVAGAREQWLRFFAYFRQAWMGTELCSFIYGMWHLVPVLAVSRWAHEHDAPQLAAAADEWLLYYGCLAQLCRDSEGQIVWAGMRSAGHQPLPGWREWAHALGMQEPLAKWEAAGRAAGLGMKQSWMWKPLHALAPTLQTAYAPLREAGADPQALLPPLGLVAPLRIVRTDRAVACLLAFNRNPNTPPWGALLSVGGQLSYLPLDGGTRIRQRFDHMSCTLEGATICYASSLYGDAQLDIPGAVESDLTLPLGMPAPPPPDDGPPPPEVHGDLAARLAAIANGVAALRLALSQQPLQNAIVAELRRGVLDRPAAQIADDVASFGIGAGQAQAPAWRQLIAEIRQLE